MNHFNNQTEYYNKCYSYPETENNATTVTNNDNNSLSNLKIRRHMRWEMVITSFFLWHFTYSLHDNTLIHNEFKKSCKEAIFHLK